ncbi:MAG: hypothetical protein OXG39_04035 [Chloroflexi bacterium]|nr:hypothetical protein [Chloroflexota bacterium]
MDSDKMRRGIIPGIIAGYVFLAFIGASMVPMMDAEGNMSMSMNNGMLEMVGGMINADAFVGFILHVIISAVIGALYTGLFADRVDLGNPLMNIAVGGLIYGLIWWIIGGNIIMPAVSGGDILSLDFQHPSLFGHVIFGHVLAFLVVLRDNAMGMTDE